MDLPGQRRSQTQREEIANSISHGLGLLGAAVAIPFLVLTAVCHGDAGTVVGAAVFDMLLKCLGWMWHPWISTGLYLLMGWLVVIAIVPLVQGLSMPGLIWLVAGGLAYTGGVIFYLIDHRPYAHFIWHLFVLAGTGPPCRRGSGDAKRQGGLSLRVLPSGNACRIRVWMA